MAGWTRTRTRRRRSRLKTSILNQPLAGNARLRGDVSLWRPGDHGRGLGRLFFCVGEASPVVSSTISLANLFRFTLLCAFILLGLPGML